MNSTQAVDLHDVDAYWKSRNLVDDRHRPYCLRWLQRFLSEPWGAGRLAPNDALAAFAQHLEQDSRTEEWQVRQAVRSVELFQKQYLGHASVETTMIYTHVIRGLNSTAESPLDALGAP